jgi:hypothetical protein
MNGFEYSAAIHMIMTGLVDEGMECITAIRQRYDGERRNPWNEFECGSNYARSMAAYALLNAFAGFSFDMVHGHIGFQPLRMEKGKFRAFWSLASGWGEVQIERKKAELRVLMGDLKVRSLELPIGKGKKLLGSIPGVVDAVIGGWQLNGIATLQGGTRATPTMAISPGRTVGYMGTSRPNVLADPKKGAARQPYNWFNTAAFASPTSADMYAGNFWGNAGAGIISNPGLVNFDVSVMKNFSIGERVRVQFRGEFFNFTNTPAFGNPGAMFGLPTFGKISSAGDPRVVQLGLKLTF